MLALCAAVFTACDLATGPPTLTVPLVANSFGQFTLDVYDSSGLIIAGMWAAPRAGSPSALVARPEQRELEVEWIGGACAHRPQLHVSGSADALQLVLSNPTEPQLPRVDCPAVGIFLGVRLSLNQSVTQDAVRLDVTN
jgi:hypothetical protein